MRILISAFCFILATTTFSARLVASPVDVTFINPGGSTEFWGDVSNTMRAAATDLDIDLEVIDTNRDRLQMVAAARNLAQREQLPDYIVIVNELQQAPALLDALEPTGVPVFVLLNDMTPEQKAEILEAGGTLDQIFGTLTPDNEVAGYEMALSLVEAARAQGLDHDGLHVLALLGDAATPAALAREAGMRRALAENPDVTLVRALPVMWSSETAEEKTAAVLKRFDLDAVWSANDQIALGAQRAAIAAGAVPGQTMLFSGLNWSDAGLNAVRDGTMTLTHGGHFFAGAWSMVMLRDLADGTVEQGIELQFPMSAVETQMAEQFLQVFGDRTWDAINFNRFLLTAGTTSQYEFTADAILKAVAGADGDGS